MPSYRAAEQFEMRPEQFDLVIIDEASESGLEALFLLWLGKQVLIVGDDLQISPSSSFYGTTEETNALKQYLEEYQARNSLMSKVSFSMWLKPSFRKQFG